MGIRNVPVISEALYERLKEQGLLFPIVLLLAILSVIWSYLSSVGNLNFNIHDDYHAYLFFPSKLLQLGTLGIDPFSERRLISGLAGNSFLLAVGLVQMKWYFLHAIDWALGMLVFVYSITFIRIRASFKTEFLVKSCLVIGLVLFSIPAANITSNVMPMAIVFAIWAWLLGLIDAQNPNSSLGVKGGLVLGAMLASLLTLKSTLTPYAAISALLILVYLKCTLIASWKQFALFFSSFLLGSTLMLLPWMIDLFQSSGSFFYPLLGKGFHAAQYGYFHGATENFFSRRTIYSNIAAVFSPLGKSVFSISILLLLFLLLQLYRSRYQSRLIIFAALPLFSSILNCLIVGYAIGGYGAYRYVYFVGLASLIISIIASSFLIQKKAMAIVIYGICIFFLVRGAQDQVMHSSSLVAEIKRAWYNQNPISMVDQDRYRAASKAIPQDGNVLLRVAYPFLLKISPNVLVADYPGAASPPPGMPIGKGPEALRSYLLSHGVSYIVWDYQSQANFGKTQYGERLSPETHPWIRSEATLSFDFQENLENMRLSGKAMYESDGISIIDLR
ncbi:hypothetical protein [Polynucleobacter sp. es-EL-1]|uniref:hypothetical protein n=1 Tax=Polynucleobacter sp. es-EL-1 TaxID=1855652 RepID=UPI001BFE57E2|nr:hypothetical protein [Polynucleobacter sp. es-EL-1]QWE10871.1 hypothetical protein FD974_01630 [Polynucleobacter sp. es-EL-1]